jgi:hypothetical protein
MVFGVFPIFRVSLRFYRLDDVGMLRGFTRALW